MWQAARVAVVSAQQLFRRRAAGTAVAGRLGRALSSAADLRPDDYVVHVEHGVGRFLGFDTKTVGGVTRDYVNLQFKGEDRLFVPHDQLAKLSRYIGADGRAAGALEARRQGLAHAALARPGRGARARRRAAAPVRRAPDAHAPRLRRSRRAGSSGSSARSPYTETEDQLRAIDEVYEDLTGEQPMDRLICGDVGFGKTEVAMRAAFLAAISGRQVLVLAPTTLLVQQHLQTFRDRFRDFPVQVEAVSRMREAGDVKKALRAFSEGKIEVLIGTHRLLSRDVIPQNLGLIVVDEEQRFGVRQKELLRQLRLEVDALSMSATPIPRTLHMSLAGLRDISVIATPPRGRQPIRTHVTEYDETLVAAAIRREIAREGQVFYLHNRVETIHEAAEKIRRLVPEARVGVGHGQMDDKQLEQAMVEFLRGDLDVLVATTIIESGLDIPQVNTLIIERADVLGLAQLYQIRGRVGRGENAAHAYLMYPDGSELSEEARARLAALADYTELGLGLSRRAARSRAARRRQPARRRAVGSRRRRRLRALLRPARRGRRRAERQPRRAHAPRAARSRARRLRPGRLRGLRGRQARRPPPHRALRDRRRAARHRDRARRPLRRAARAGREPHPRPGGAHQAGGCSAPTR